MDMTPVISSNLAAVGWADDTLRVQFLNGRTYEYEGVSEGTYHALMNSGSVGGYFMAVIKNQYPTQEV
jgi:hypothetical protein